jgi:hypothetical protein
MINVKPMGKIKREIITSGTLAQFFSVIENQD